VKEKKGKYDRKERKRELNLQGASGIAARFLKFKKINIAT
jgi:hypothetical protein